MKKVCSVFFIALLCTSCAVHQRSNIKADEEFVVELTKPISRGSLIETALQGLFLGANYLAEKTSKSLSSSYSQKISINDYYNTDLGAIEKTYNEIHIKKYSKPSNLVEKNRLTSIMETEVSGLRKSRGQASVLTMNDLIRVDQDDLLNFHAIIELISHPENPGVSRLSFKDLRVFFSKTKVFSDENLNAKISISIEGQWRTTDGSPMKAVLIEQEYDFKNLKYGIGNQLEDPILSPWYYDIPIYSDVEDISNYGVLEINIQLEEYEGNKSKYISKLPSILSDNKNAIIKNGASTIQKLSN